ncbi:uncharacterized protein [Paramormyrops kingsleyae]|uniref:uncharacterized protein isoform X2 n=2 Tax=Paramormyrops kingsleyae TaxID=1676925 RepID=UPI000CD6674E|nr:uncharacterized protein LOC111840496 isoform X2 [Paramormyrops kingsleyae]
MVKDMSGKTKSRSATNAELTSISCYERILQECHQMYTEVDSGLISLAQSVGVTILPPRKKITVMLMGNHSAGMWKSTSCGLEWPLKHKASVSLPVVARESLLPGMQLYISTLTTNLYKSLQKHFSLLTFVDSPGLVDGDMKYPFDVDQALLWLGNLCDLILVFFDPMGQALCKRTLNIVEKLNESHGDKLRFYLSKADEAGSESDRQRVMMQIVQELCKRPGLNKCAFDMPTIYIPNPNKPSRCVNQIEDVCRTIEKTFNQTVQNTLNSLEKDCQLITDAIRNALSTDRKRSREKWRAQCKGCLLGLMGFSVPLSLLMLLLLGSLSRETVELTLGKEGTEALSMYLLFCPGLVTSLICPSRSFCVRYYFLSFELPVLWVLDSFSVQQQFYFCSSLVLLSFILLLLARSAFRTQLTLTGRQKRQLQEKLEYIDEAVKNKKKTLYEEYFRQSIGDYDIDSVK